MRYILYTGQLWPVLFTHKENDSISLILVPMLRVGMRCKLSGRSSLLPLVYLVSRELCCARQALYPIIYEIRDDALIINVIKIAHRPKAYKDN